MTCKRTALLLVLLALANGQAQAQACDDTKLQPMLDRFAVATSLPLADCVREIQAVGGDAFWQKECRRIEASPDAAMLREHGRRMSIQFKELQINDDGATAVIVNLHGPDVLAFNETLDRWKLCRAGAELDRAKRDDGVSAESCGPWSWADIPVIDRYGAIPLACKNGAWTFVAPEESGDKPSDTQTRKQ